MRTFAIFLLLFAVAALVSGLLTYPAWAAIQTFADVPIHRVMNRIGMVVLAVATVIFLRRRQLANKATLGYDMPRSQFVRQLFLGFAAGVLLMIPLALALFGLDLRVWSDKFLNQSDPAMFVIKAVLAGLLTGWVVAFVEETFCRGAMFTAIQRESGVLWAIALPTLFYAATHFMGGKLRLPADQITYLSGLTVTANLFERFARPLEFVDTFLALSALGVLLSLIRLRTGVIAGCIGLHAGGVTVIQTLHRVSADNPSAAHGWLTGTYDGVIGWLAFAWIALIAALYWNISSPARRASRA